MTHLTKRTSPANLKCFEGAPIVRGRRVFFPAIIITFFVIDVLDRRQRRRSARFVVHFRVVVAPILHDVVVPPPRSPIDVVVERLVQRAHDGREYQYLVRSVVIHDGLGYLDAFDCAGRMERGRIEGREDVAVVPIRDISWQSYAKGRGRRGVHVEYIAWEVAKRGWGGVDGGDGGCHLPVRFRCGPRGRPMIVLGVWRCTFLLSFTF
jgi:hypothetical protein